MKARFDLPRGRALALAILLLLVWGGIELCVALYTAYAANGEEIAARREMLGRLGAVAAQSDAIDAWIVETASLSQDGSLLPGDGGAMTSAELQANVVNLAAQHGAVLTSFRVLESSAADGFVDVPVAISIQGPFANVVATVQAVESSLPLLFVETAQFRTAGAAGAGGGEEVPIDLQMEIHGFARAGSGKQS
jgi:hypothetical protein